MNEESLPSAAPEPAPTPPPVPDPPPDVEPAAPVQVISVDELLELLAPEEVADLETPPDADPTEAAADVPAVDPYTALIEQVIGKIVEVGIDLGKIERHTKEIEKDTGVISEQITVVAQAVNHPALITSFADYTVTEALLLFLLLAAFLSACARMLRGGLSWLRS